MRALFADIEEFGDLDEADGPWLRHVVIRPPARLAARAPGAQ